MIFLALVTLAVIVAGAACCCYALSRRLSVAEELLSRERARASELAGATAEAFAARRALEVRVRAMLPPPLAAAVLSGREVRATIVRLDTPEDLRRALERVGAEVIPIRRNDPTKN